MVKAVNGLAFQQQNRPDTILWGVDQCATCSKQTTVVAFACTRGMGCHSVMINITKMCGFLWLTARHIAKGFSRFTTERGMALYSNGCENCGSHLQDFQLHELGGFLCCDFSTHDSLLAMWIESDRSLPCVADLWPIENRFLIDDGITRRYKRPHSTPDIEPFLWKRFLRD